MTDKYVIKYNSHDMCRHKNILVCKDCTVDNIRGLTLTTMDGSFEIFCFDAARVENNVSLCCWQ